MSIADAVGDAMGVLHALRESLARRAIESGAQLHEIQWREHVERPHSVELWQGPEMLGRVWIDMETFQIHAVWYEDADVVCRLPAYTVKLLGVGE
jgi:hypothetical protein